MPTPHAGQWGPEAFQDRRGNGLPSVAVAVYDSQGGPLSTLYSDRDRTATVANPLPTGVAGGTAGVDDEANALFWAEPGNYWAQATYNGTVRWAGPIVVDTDQADIVGGGGTVTSVNGQVGPAVVLTAGDVGADAAGTAASAVGAHAVAVDPHGDRVYADGLVDDLSGVTNAPAARTALGLGTAATQPSTAFDAAGDASAAQAAAIAAAVALVDDLSGVTDPGTARTNLGLGTAATQATGDFDAAGAAAAAQAFAIQRANHTGTQAQSTVTNLVTDLAAKATAVSRTAVKTSAYAAAAGDLVPADASGGSFTITLPTAPANRTLIAVAVIGLGANLVTVACGGSDVMSKTGGPTTRVLGIIGEVAFFQYDSATAVWTPSEAGMSSVAAATTDTVFRSRVTGDANDRFSVSAAGVLRWSGGAAGSNVCSLSVASDGGSGPILQSPGHLWLRAAAGQNVRIGQNVTNTDKCLFDCWVVSFGAPQVRMQSAAVGNVTFPMKAIAGQTAGFMLAESSTGVALFRVDVTGKPAFSEAANGPQGVAALIAGTVTVANTNVTANSRIFVQRQTDGGTVAASYSITRTPGTSFTITAKDGAGANQTADTSTIAYLITEPA